MLKSSLGAALFLVVWPLTTSAQPSFLLPFAYFSPQRAFAASPEGKDADTKLTTLQAERAKELDTRNQRLKALQDVAPETTERFEVASVKPNKDPVPGLVPTGSFDAGPMRFRAHQATLQELMVAAYDVFGFEIVGVPNWATSDRFDIVATMAEGAPSGETPRLRRMLRALLADRFNLVVHEERREMPMYSLVVARSDRALGLRLLPFKGECAVDPSKVKMPDLTRPLPPSDPSKGPQLCISGLRVGRIQGRGVSVAELTTMLSRLAAVRRRVVDKTGLTGLFDYDMEWAATAPLGVPVLTDRPGETGPDIFTALQEQLGLKLEPGRDGLRVMVVDRVSQPSPD